MKNLLISFLLLISIPSFSQDECFGKYVFPDHSFKLNSDTAARFAYETMKKDRLQFIESIKGCKAPNFKAVTINGDSIELNKFKGKIVLIAFWDSEFSNCVDQITELNLLAAKYKSNDIVVIGLTSNKTDEIKNNFLPQHPFDCKIIANAGYPENEGSIPAKYRVQGIPSQYLLDKEGRVKWVSNSGQYFGDYDL
jgi:peroxiredoxin